MYNTILKSTIDFLNIFTRNLSQAVQVEAEEDRGWVFWGQPGTLDGRIALPVEHRGRNIHYDFYAA